jgi:hypothetical protein
LNQENILHFLLTEILELTDANSDLWNELLMNPETDTLTAETTGADTADSGNPDASVTYLCPDCGAPMLIIATFQRAQRPRAPPAGVERS